MGLLWDAVSFVNHRGKTPLIKNIDHLSQWSQRRKNGIYSQTPKPNRKTINISNPAGKKDSPSFGS